MLVQDLSGLAPLVAVRHIFIDANVVDVVDVVRLDVA